MRTENWLIVGLGNPGPEYFHTRHNLGFMVVAALAEAWGIPLNRQKLDAVWGQGRAGGKSVVLAQPATYMNLSGKAVSLLLAYFHLTPQDLLVIHDDLDVPFGRLKIVMGGGAGGHRGVLSILNALGTGEFYRLKLGLGRPPEHLTAEDFVLRSFQSEELPGVADLVEQAAQAAKLLVAEGLSAAQNRFHRSNHEETAGEA